ncbi:CRISPR-associated protein Cmr6 [Thermosipho japonicus]|uniref:CRISPR-associated protein Cmr6 n=1 Tax=Thermosipho japonicus TaxID=90323 RepID=A0A841GM42_9BACT|nr:type III-B CRISPR module RAMP protein Cmr6 [Thermosipho japonicus]MBB6063457.1 CRISPR-associated protein Cmr6 [Thermosipho japonicus]
MKVGYKEDLGNKNIKSLSLFYDKYVYYNLHKNSSKKKNEEQSKDLNNLFKAFFDNDKRYIYENSKILNDVFSKVLKQLETSGYHIYEKSFELSSPLLIGSGIPSAYEVGIYLNRNYGLPVIPGQSIKGAFKAFLDEIEESDLIFFGNNENSSEIFFFDAVPEKYELGIDILNPHFKEYYLSEKVPNDVYQPVPISFISVFEGRYVFRYVIISEKIDEDKNKRISKYFEDFLSLYGIGAKTSMGYGRFKK